MGLVTVFWPLTMTGAGETVVQVADEKRFVVDCKVNLVAWDGQNRLIRNFVGSYGAASLKYLCEPATELV